MGNSLRLEDATQGRSQVPKFRAINEGILTGMGKGHIPTKQLNDRPDSQPLA